MVPVNFQVRQVCKVHRNVHVVFSKVISCHIGQAYYFNRYEQVDVHTQTGSICLLV